MVILYVYDNFSCIYYQLSHIDKWRDIFILVFVKVSCYAKAGAERK